MPRCRTNTVHRASHFFPPLSVITPTIVKEDLKARKIASPRARALLSGGRCCLHLGNSSCLSFIAALLLLCSVALAADPVDFNNEVASRVIDQLSNFMSRLKDTNIFMSKFFTSPGFPLGRHSIRPSDRDLFLKMSNILHGSFVCYAGEDGTYIGLWKEGQSFGVYREPANSGYDVATANKSGMEKHYRSCVNASNGMPATCDMVPGQKHIRCVDGCSLVPCPGDNLNENGAKDSSSLETHTEPTGSLCELTNEEKEKKYCTQYDIVEVEDDGVQRGFIPLTLYCHGVMGEVTAQPGTVVERHDSIDTLSACDLGNCTYADGITLVNRTLAGAYAYCGDDENAVCSDTFVGGYDYLEYDHRYRPWYIETKRRQKPTFTEPYLLLPSGMGVTLTYPVYSDIDGKKVFVGMFAVDYFMETITSFLVESYGGNKNSEVHVAIYEDAEPNYIIALSTGTNATSSVLKSDHDKPCPVQAEATASVQCEPVRAKMTDLDGGRSKPGDWVLMQAFLAHKDAGYPKATIPVSRFSNSESSRFYSSHSALYEQIRGEPPRWRVVVTSPGKTSDSDAILHGMPMFAAVLAVGMVGFAICSAFFAAIYSKRSKRAVAFADWRFTCAFIAGCALLNLSTMTLVGPNTNELCLTRMWSFHLLLVIALAPLLVKVYRIHRLIGRTGLDRATITHFQAFIWCVPPVLMQVVLLTIVTIIDPPQQAEEMDIVGTNTITQHIVCSAETPLHDVLPFGYEACLLLAGCVLAYRTRNMDKRFRETKQLIFSIYTIASVSVVFWVVIVAGNFTYNGEKMLRVVGTFWATVFSTAAFVLPPLLEVHSNSGNKREGVVKVTGTNHRLTGETNVCGTSPRT